MNNLNYLTLVAAIANFVLGLIVFLRNPRKTVYILFGIVGLVTGIWCLLNFMFWLSPQLFLFKSQYAFGPLVVISSIFWIETFLGKLSRTKLMFFSALLVVLFCIPLVDGLVISHLDIASGSQLIFGHGPLFDIYSIVINILFLYVAFRLLRERLRAKGMVKKQLNYMLFGMVSTGLISVIFIFVLPFFGISLITSIDAQSTLIFVACSAYAIVKHRLMDIRMIVARSVAYTILMAIIAAFYVVTVLVLERALFPNSMDSLNYAQMALRAVVTLVVVFTFQPLKKFITKVTDKIFFKQSYNPEKVLDKLSHTMGSSIVLIELMYKTLNILIQDMKVSRGFFVILKDKDTIATTHGVGYKNLPKINLKDIHLLSENSIFVFDELDEGSKLKAVLRRHDASVAIPLKSSNGLSGILFLGEKSSGDMYSRQDLNIFEIIGPEVAVAIDNAKSYEEIQKFNAVLRSEIKKATSELELANNNLRDLDKAKDEFISMASHQLRTPLTAIKGYLSMLLEGDAGEIKMAQFDFIKESYDGANRMVALINDLLNVSRMETGRFFLDISEFDLNKVVEEEVNQLKKFASDKDLKLKLDAKKVPMALGDELKMRQVVMNFIDNALHYTLDGTVTVKLYPDSEDADKIYFEVNDTGLGIPKEQQKHLFAKFYRAENARRVRPDGTGLGIFMAKRVIEEHGAKLIFESEEGKGSKFGFCLSRKEMELKQKVMPSLNMDSVTPKGVKDTEESKEEEKKAVEAPKEETEKEPEKEKVAVK